MDDVCVKLILKCVTYFLAERCEAAEGGNSISYWTSFVTKRSSPCCASSEIKCVVRPARQSSGAERWGMRVILHH